NKIEYSKTFSGRETGNICIHTKKYREEEEQTTSIPDISDCIGCSLYRTTSVFATTLIHWRERDSTRGYACCCGHSLSQSKRHTIGISQ
ncbi:hypothetical protein, partial [uncultured Parabacteroides sp.]|uniref:hypothetical protein n=1 Tax=uncultured Parabacteroides sp. TaxID=512312 RepID=UPI00272CC69C